MEIYDKTHIKFTDSKEENKTQKDKRKSNLDQNFCLFHVLILLERITWQNNSLIKHGVIYSSFHDKKQEMSKLDAVVSAIYPKRCIMSLSLGINLFEIGDKVTYQLPLLDHKMSLVHWVHHFFILEAKSFL